MSIKRSYRVLLLLLKVKFGKLIRQKDKRIAEILTILVMGHHLGQDTVSAICERLEIPKHQIYTELRQMNVQQWRKLFTGIFDEYALEELQEVFGKSASTISRAKIVLSIDDSVLRRWRAGALGYIGKWWSGQFKRLVIGQDVILITLKIKERVIPVRMWLMSKKGRCNNRHERVGRLVKQLGQQWKDKGLDISKITLTMDAGYADKKLIDWLRQVGFTKLIVGAKKNYKIRSHRSKTKATRKLEEILSVEQVEQAAEEAWAVDEKVAIYQAISPTFGRITVMARYMLGKMRYVFAYSLHRAAEIFGLWRAHYRIEQVFKRLKQYLGWGKSRLRAPQGAHANVVLPFLAYYIVLCLQKQFKNVTFEKIIRNMNFWDKEDILEILQNLDVEHLHSELLNTHSASSS